MNIAIVVMLMVAGVLLLVAELFILPGFGVAGFSGFALLAGAIVWSYWKLAPLYPWAGHVTLAACILLSGLTIYLLLRSKTLDKMALNTTINSSVSLAEPGKKIEKLEKGARKIEEKEERTEAEETTEK